METTGMRAEIREICQPDGYRMAVRHWSCGSEHKNDAPLILLHSLFFTGEMFESVVPAMSQGYDCAAPTFRGQDGRGRGDRTPTVEQLAQDLFHWLDQDGHDRVHLVGSSMGAYVAMEMLRHRPEQVVTVVLSCCTADAEQDTARFAALTDFLSSGPDAQTRDTIARLMFGETALSTPSSAVSLWIERFAQTPAAMAEVADCMFAHPSYHDALTAFSGPALLLAGRQDKAKSPADMMRIAAHLPHAEFHVFQTSGHTPAVEVPDEFAERVLTFLDRAALGANDRERVHAH